MPLLLLCLLSVGAVGSASGLPEPPRLQATHTIPGQSGLAVVRFLPDGETLVVGLPDGTLKLFETQSRTLLRTLDGSGTYLQDAAISPDGSLVLVGCGSPLGSTDRNVVEIRDLESGATVREFFGHSDWVVVSSTRRTVRWS